MEEAILIEEIREVEYSAKITKNPFTKVSTLDVFSDREPCAICVLEENASFQALQSNSFCGLTFSFNTFLKDDFCRVRFHVHYHNGIVQKGDKLSFLFEDDSIQDFYIEDEYGNIQLYDSDFYLLMTKQVKLARYEDEACDYTCQFKFDVDNSEKLIDYTAFFLRAIEKAWGWKPEIQPEPELLQVEEISSFEEIADFCYVYLMLDNNTGLYKIGMSNNPEIRERTLQSEKPTIIKVSEKRLPSREIAAAMEKMLHSIFSDKRVRGEWFKLTSLDIWKIQEILK